jgi:hypothetical protein
MIFALTLSQGWRADVSIRLTLYHIVIYMIFLIDLFFAMIAVRPPSVAAWPTPANRKSRQPPRIPLVARAARIKKRAERRVIVQKSKLRQACSAFIRRARRETFREAVFLSITPR